MSRGAAIAFVAALMVAYVAGYAYSASIQDTARDVWHAWAIRNGAHFPLEGPVLGGPVGGAMHLGPAWYYLLALPLFVHPSWLAAALFTGLVASLKFPLAYWCGTRLVDRGFGLLWAACLAAPGWSSIETLIFFNPNPSAAIVLLALLLALRVGERAPSDRESALFGLVFCLALHVHPANAPVGLLGLAFVASARLAGASPARTLVFMAAGFALPLLPYLASQWAQGFNDFGSTAAHVKGRIHVSNLLGIPAVFASQVVFGPVAMARLAGMGDAWAWALAAASSVPVALAAIFALRRGATAEARAVAAGMGILALVACAWIALLRATTPEYFLYPLAPMTAALAALGLHGLARHRAGRALALAIAAALVTAGLVTLVRMAAIVRHGEGVLTSQVLDVKAPSPERFYAETWFPASGRAALGRFLCARPDGVATHGHLAFVVDRSVGVDALLECGRAAHVRLGGNEAVQHWAGLSRRFWSRIDSRGSCRLGSLELVEATPVFPPGRGLAIPDGRRYFPRDHATAPLARHTVEVDARADEALLLTNVLHGYQPLGAVEARANGAAIAPAASNDLSMLFVAPGAAEEAVRWVISFETALPEGVDLVTFPRRPAPSPTPECR